MQVIYRGLNLSQRGKIVRALVFSALSAVLFLSLASCNGLFDPEDPLTTAEVEARVFKLVNDHRLGIGRNALIWNDAMAAEERAHSQAMAAGQVPIGHQGFEARSARINEIIPWSVISENVAFHGSAEDALDAWLQSRDHQVIIEGDYDLTGVGVAKNPLNSFYYISQMFLKPL